MIITMVLLSGEEVVAELVMPNDGIQLVVKKPLCVERVEVDNSLATRLNRYMSLDNGEESVFYARNIVCSSVCSQKIVDYYTKVVDKYYSDSLETSQDPEEVSSGGITTEEILSLISGRIKLQ